MSESEPDIRETETERIADLVTQDGAGRRDAEEQAKEAAEPSKDPAVETGPPEEDPVLQGMGTVAATTGASGSADGGADGEYDYSDDGDEKDDFFDKNGGEAKDSPDGADSDLGSSGGSGATEGPDGGESEAVAAAAASIGNEATAVDEEVYKLRSHRRLKATESGETTQDKPKEKRRQRRRPTPEPEQEKPEQEEEIDEATRERKELEARIDAALQPASKRRKKLAGDDLEMMQDDLIARLRDSMREAALQDVESIRQGEPAIHKIRMLPEVVETLQKGSLADSILDGNLLESVRIWLEPLPDTSLPSFEIQKAMFAALISLPIKTIHLRESGLGRVVLFYQKSKRPQPAIKRMAQKLIGDWTRPIIGRSDNYRDKRIATASFDPRESPSSSRSQSRAGSAAPRSSYEESAARRNRAALPSSTGISYQVAPVSSNSFANQSQNGPKTDSQLRRMKTKLMSSGRGSRSRKSQVSVEGKNLN